MTIEILIDVRGESFANDYGSSIGTSSGRSVLTGPYA